MDGLEDGEEVVKGRIEEGVCVWGVSSNEE